VGLLYIWTFLASVAWAIAEVALRREPRLTRLGLCLIAGAAGVLVALLVGGRGGLSLRLSFPFCLGASFAACVIAGSGRCPMARGEGAGLP
ncbi:MAG TPA: hypothetical protein VK821_04790, partial [Dehalococcoidia bacterium]|nr:hypothetical protein [Dehalococcoidia bacterium]